MNRLRAHSVVRATAQLRLHRAFDEFRCVDLVGELNQAARLKDLSVPEPLLLTTSGTILSGFGRWRLAVSDGWGEIECIEYPLSEDEALQFILTHHQTRRGWNAFVRICLALTLEPSFQNKALENMRVGGRCKGSSNLTEAMKVDVRTKIAAAAGVSTGNVTKVKEVMRNAISAVLRALRDGEISIHCAWKWRKESPERQREALLFYRSEKGVKKTIRTQLAKQRPKDPPVVLTPESLARHLATLDSRQLGQINVVVQELPGRIVVMSKELVRTIGLQEELIVK